MDKLLRLSKSCIGDQEKEAVIRVMNEGYFGMGKEVKKFEEELSEFFNKPALCVVNGTAALQLAIEAAGIGSGDEILVQSLTYVASFQAITASGAKPVACDVCNDFGIDIDDAKNKISKKTKAIMPVHYAGNPARLKLIYDFAKKHNLRVIEDAAHAFGSKYEGQRIGFLGDIVCFSFDGIKNITSGEGGCVVSSDENIISAIKNSRLLGVHNDTENRFEGHRTWNPDVTSQGWRYHMSDLMAAIGRVQLKNFEYLKNKRQQLAKIYIDLLSNNPFIKTNTHDYTKIVPHIFVIEVSDEIDRDKLIAYLLKHGIPTGLHYKPNHMLSFFKTDFTLKNTEKIYSKILTLPLHPDLEDSDIHFISKKIKEGVLKCKDL